MRSLADYYSQVENQLYYTGDDIGRSKKHFFGLKSITLASAETNRDALRYNQRARFAPIPITGREAVSVELDNIPPGKYFVRAEFAFFPEVKVNWSGRLAEALLIGTPLAFKAVTIDEQTEAVTLEVFFNDVEVDLVNVPQSEAGFDLDIPIMLFLERAECETAFGASILFSQLRSEAFREKMVSSRFYGPGMPFLSWFGSFSAWTPDAPYYKYAPALFRAVPPGEYVLRAYRDGNEILTAAPFEERTITVGGTDELIKIELRYPDAAD